MRVMVGKVEAREGNEAVVSLSDGSTRRIRVPEWEKVVPGLSVRIIEATYPDMAPSVGWGEDERVAERERLHGYVRATLTLARTEDGGRKGPFASGYRPQWDLGHRTEDGSIAFSDAEVWLEDGLMLSPGGTAPFASIRPFRSTGSTFAKAPSWACMKGTDDLATRTCWKSSRPRTESFPASRRGIHSECLTTHSRSRGS